MGDDPIKRKKVIASFIWVNGWESRQEGEKMKQTESRKASQAREKHGPVHLLRLFWKLFCEIFEALAFKQIQTPDCPIALWHSYSGCGTIRANYPAVSKAKLTGTILWLNPGWKDNYAAFCGQREKVKGCIKTNGSCSFVVRRNEFQVFKWHRFTVTLHVLSGQKSRHAA